MVDDDALLLRSLTRSLKSRFAVTSATSPLEALEILRDRGPQFFAILSDVHMPEMTGPVFLAKAASLAPDARALLMSGGLSLSEAPVAAAGLRIFRFLQKPVATGALVEAVEDAWRDHQSRGSS